VDQSGRGEVGHFVEMPGFTYSDSAIGRDNPAITFDELFLARTLTAGSRAVRCVIRTLWRPEKELSCW
jgi:hypothetical protein